jgi:hypothetical protein
MKCEHDKSVDTSWIDVSSSDLSLSCGALYLMIGTRILCAYLDGNVLPSSVSRLVDHAEGTTPQPFPHLVLPSSLRWRPEDARQVDVLRRGLPKRATVPQHDLERTQRGHPFNALELLMEVPRVPQEMEP